MPPYGIFRVQGCSILIREEFDGFRSLEEYIKANPPKGLGASIELIDKLINKDEDLRAKFYAALRRPHGGDRKSDAAKEMIKSDNVTLDRGNSKAYALQKLSDEGQMEKLIRKDTDRKKISVLKTCQTARWDSLDGWLE